ncbi:Exodeoxyribonuclease III [Photobacterium sp. SKA34]|uniref:endonuclease/exonuclease/phosphatase family protein n=1 Tax=Photobacterium sp. SKA34 TaxID=121723 RepID=UPI00006ABEB1|nr:endonuclease/exonuclease/phosphatase family protein [Photobacterium sp. SKA34]EAR53417.1 Exodeoxyribonuclease III [Photobacterium sp. SKA34]
MKLLTLNTHSWQEQDQLEKLDIVAKAIIEQDCDVIALQEVNQRYDSSIINASTVSNFPVHSDNYAYLLQQRLLVLGHQYYLTWDFVHQSYDVYQEGLAFLSREPVIEHQVIDLNDNYDENHWKHRRAVRITLGYKEQTLDIYNCHCGWWNDVESPFQQHIERIQSCLSDRLSLFLGDFNTPSHLVDEGYSYLIQQGFIDTYTSAQMKDDGNTVVKCIDGWQNNHEALRIDYVFSNQDVSVSSHKVIFNGDYYPIVSDHFGLIVSLDLH